MKFGKHTELELKKIAIDIVDGHIFTDRDIKEYDGSLIASIFMPIALGAFSGESEESLKEIGMMYEYYDKAGPRSINSYPMFTSFNVLSKPQTLEVVEFANKYINMKHELLNSTSVVHTDA